MTFNFCRALPTRPKPRPEGCTVHDPEEPNRCWAVVTRIKSGRLTQPYQCLSRAMHRRLTCYAHRAREAEARELKDAMSNAQRDPSFCEVDSHHLWIMVLGYVRYAMGRMSTAPSTASELVRVYWERFRTQEQEQILSEVAQELEAYERSGLLLGRQCDHETWTELRDWMRGRLV